MLNQAKLFKCNKELTQLEEWCIATDKKEAYKFLDEHWDDGEIMEAMYVKEYLEKNPGKTLDDFIDYFFIEEDPEKDFTHPYGGANDEPITKKVKEWIDMGAVPSYLCHEKW